MDNQSDDSIKRFLAFLKAFYTNLTDLLANLFDQASKDKPEVKVSTGQEENEKQEKTVSFGYLSC